MIESMTDPQHKGGWTPGLGRNWIASTGPSGYGAHDGVSVTDNRGLVVAVAIGDVPELDARSNARLIAAAPEMADDGAFLLARLDDFEREVETESGDGAVRHWHGHVVPAIARFRAALAKASPDKSGGA